MIEDLFNQFSLFFEFNFLLMKIYNAPKMENNDSNTANHIKNVPSPNSGILMKK